VESNKNKVKEDGGGSNTAVEGEECEEKEGERFGGMNEETS
jgi:hypothetical protein